MALAPKLAGKGVLVPLAGRKRFDRNHYRLLLSHKKRMRGKWVGNDPWAALEEEILGCPADRIVITAEGFAGKAASMTSPARIASLAEAIDADVRIIAYVRPQYQMLESKYSQFYMTHKSASETFAEFKARQLASDPLDWCKTFEPWRNAFGAPSVIVTPLERSRLGGDVRTHFLRLLGGFDSIPHDTSSQSNVRRGAKTLAVQRMTGLAIQASGRIVKRRSRLKPDQIAAVLESDAPFAGLTPEEVVEVTDLFEASNARFARDYGIDAGGVLFRDPIPAYPQRPHQASWTDLSDRERWRARRLVLDVLGLDIAPREPAGAGYHRAIDRAWVRLAATRSGSRQIHRWRALSRNSDRARERPASAKPGG